MHILLALLLKTCYFSYLDIVKEGGVGTGDQIAEGSLYFGWQCSQTSVT